MASVLGSIPAIPSSCTCSSFASSTVVSLLSLSRWTDSDRKLLGFRRSSVCRAMIQQAVQGAPAAYAKEMERLSAKESLLLAIESKFVLSTRLSVEGPLRMKEEYVEGILESPTVIEERVPEQLKGALGQAVRTMQQLPVPIWDAASHGLTIPLSVSFQRFFMISYLDQEILIIRNTARVPEVLTRLDVSPSSLADQAIPNNES
ncbi:Plastid-lipid associated protein PAP / fibrillin family protein [Quillaja saponaria]|uniref:Plastid-lipid associated protein PAP / fibrillin family protein n=1 Tax=Quillaja saponaria TaxID=32244 RepID=A0AAD7PYF9_QUISA|nr:Plastid-lipid associated protein PAP / fibrillin family protein [Quillaja saponaria]